MESAGSKCVILSSLPVSLSNNSLLWHTENFAASKIIESGSSKHNLQTKAVRKKKEAKEVRWCRAQDLLGSQIPVTTGGFELRISCIQSSYLTH